MDQNIMILWIVAWLSALGFAFWRLRWVESQSQGTDEIAKIAGHIRSGAMAFLNREYRVLAVFVLVVAILLFLGYNSKDQGIIALAFVFGAILFGVYGFTVGALFKDYSWKLALLETLWGGILYTSTTYLTHKII